MFWYILVESVVLHFSHSTLTPVSHALRVINKPVHIIGWTYTQCHVIMFLYLVMHYQSYIYYGLKLPVKVAGAVSAYIVISFAKRLDRFLCINQREVEESYKPLQIYATQSEKKQQSM